MISVSLNPKAGSGDSDPHIRSTTERKVQLGFAFAMVCVALVTALSFVRVRQLSDDTAWLEHTYQVLNTLDELLDSAREAQLGGRRYVNSGDLQFLERYRRAVERVHLTLTRLRDLTVDNHEQQARLIQVEALTADRLAELSRAIALRQTTGAEASRDYDPSQGQLIYDRLQNDIGAMKTVESSLLTLRRLRSRQASDAAHLVTVSGGVLATLVAGLALTAIRRDFAGRARAERELRQAKAQLEVRVRERAAELAGIIESTDDAIITKTLEGVITSWNPAAQRLFGYAADEAIGRSMQILIPQDRTEEEPAILARIGRGERVEHFETVRRRADGTLIQVSATISPLLDGTGRIVGASKIARDITEQKTHAERMRAQLERLSLLQHLTRAIGGRQDLASIFQVVVRSLEEHLGIDFACIAGYERETRQLEILCVGAASLGLARGLNLVEQERIGVEDNGLDPCTQGQLIYEPDISAASSSLESRLARGGLRALVVAPLNVESHVSGMIVAARRAPGSFTSADCEFLRQLSEHLALAAHHVQLYSSLQRAYEDLRQTQHAVMQQERLRALGQMASGIAHDINNALSVPAIYAQLLLEHNNTLSGEAREQLQVIQRSLDDIARTIARLRMFYRPREFEEALSAVDLNALLQQVIELTRVRWRDMPQQQGLSIELVSDLAPDLPSVMAAENEIRDALLNLVFNASDAMPQGGTLTLCSRLDPNPINGIGRNGETQYVIVEVRDTGVGMPEAVRSRCLEPFFTTKGERGTGLGLAMVYGMTQRHNADLEIDSEPGVGTTVRLTFPAVKLAAAQSPAAPDVAATPLRVLLIDDDPALLRSLRELLEAEGHRIVVAEGGQRGIDEFFAAHQRGEPFVAVITDLGMPSIDGRTVAAAVKSVAPTVPVILLTGWGQSLRADDKLPEHIDRVLSKPPKLMQLRAALAELA